MKQVIACFTFSALVACVVGGYLPINGTRILRGKRARCGEFPWMVSLQISDSHICGGSIIGPSTILTAAHCGVRFLPSNIMVVSGTVNLTDGGTRRRVSKIIIHPDYSAKDSWRNDIAILKLQMPIAFTDTEKPIALPAQDEATVDQAVAQVSGWGYTSTYSWYVPEDLQKLNMTLVENHFCNDAFTDNDIYPTNLCAGGVEGEGVCNADSGGPLMTNGKLIGIVSFGRRCARGVPDVFTRVASYTEWIAEHSDIP